MQESVIPRAMAAARSTASSLGLTADDAIVVHDSNRLTLRLLPCDVLARVAPVAHRSRSSKSTLLIGSPSPGARWLLLSLGWSRASTSATASRSRCGPTTSPCHLERSRQPTTPTALARLHAGMRKLDVATPHFTDRVEEARRLVASRDDTPALADADRELLGDTLRSLRRRSANAAPPSSCCTASRTRATCSTRRTGCCSSTSRRAAVDRSSSTSPMRPKRSASTIRASIMACCASAGSSCWR